MKMDKLQSNLSNIVDEADEISNVTNEEMKKEYNKKCDALIALLLILYGKYKLDNKFNVQNKAIIMKEIKDVLNKHVFDLSYIDKQKTTKMLFNILDNTYRKSNIMLASMLSKPLKTILNADKSKIINKPIANKVFTNRIKKNKVKMYRRLVSTIDYGIDKGYGLKKIIKLVNHTFIISIKESERLVETEKVRVINSGLILSYKVYEISKVMYSTSISRNMCDRCYYLHGTIYPINKVENSPPTHPFCRCFLTPII
jgi:SPP1 gp7 family putative phage head morphogenesis protein